ncbi:MAG: hypothetical protein JWQ35_509 [Bacteriovoracaceae bacterium]|nr:hypothetical protein [Bacteriovoracaceae bacterium]
MTAGGDWENPVFFIIYWDGKALRGYIPTKGNLWNTDTKQAYGNDEESDAKNLLERFPDVFGDKLEEEINAKDLSFNAQEITEDIQNRIVPKQ